MASVQQVALCAAASLFVVLPVAYLLHRFPAPGTPLAAQFVAAAAYGAALLVTALVPLDVYTSNQGGKPASQARDARNALQAVAVAWNLAYWSAVGATVVLPLVQVRSCPSASLRCQRLMCHALWQAYYSSYEWTAFGRLRAAAHATARFYALAAAAGAVGVAALLVSGRLESPAALLGIAAAAGNLYGMLGCIVLLSYGLVDIPRSLWRGKSVDAASRNVGHAAIAAEAAAVELCRAVAIARATGALLPRRSSALQRAQVSKLLSEIADVAVAAHDAAPLAAHEAAADGAIMDEAEQYIDDAAALACLRRRVHEAASAFQRAHLSYTRACSRGLRAVDDDAAIACDGAQPAWAPSASRVHNCCGLRLRRRHFASTTSPLETPSAATEARWYWRCMLLPILRRSVAAVLALLSALVVLAEASTFATPGSAGDLSVFSRMLRALLAHGATARAALLSAAVLAYLTAATFYTVFALGAFPTFRLAPHASDAPSLLAGAALLCRFAPSLVLNYFSVVHAADSSDAVHTVFYEQIGRKLDAVPLLGAHAAAAFPVALLLLVALLAANVFDRALRFCRWKGSDEDEAAAHAAATQRGRELLEREEANVRAGLQPGLALLAPAVETGPPAEQAAAPTGGAVMEALHRHGLRTGAPPRWTPRPLPPPLPAVTDVPLLARLRQGAAAARTRMESVFRADDERHQMQPLSSADTIEDDAAPLLDSARAPSTSAMLDAVFERIERGKRNSVI